MSLHLCVYCVCMHTHEHAMMPMWSQDNLQESVFSHTTWGLGLEPGSSCLVPSPRTSPLENFEFKASPATRQESHVKQKTKTCVTGASCWRPRLQLPDLELAVSCPRLCCCVIQACFTRTGLLAIFLINNPKRHTAFQKEAVKVRIAQCCMT